MTDASDLRSLFANYISGDISSTQLQALEAALSESSYLRRDFIEYMNIESAICDLAAISEHEIAEIGIEVTVNADQNRASTVETGNQAIRFRLRGVTIFGIIAASLLVTFFWFGNPSNEIKTSVATLVTNIEANVLYNGEPWNDSELGSGEYQMDSGLIHLQFAGGVMVFVEAPARFDAVSGKRLVLHNGRLSASVPPEGIGFTVETPEAEVIDFGTEFSVDVESGESEVHVFEGLVRVQPKTSTDGREGEVIELRTDQAVKVMKAKVKPVDIELATDRFIRTFDEPRRKYAKAVKQLSPVAFYRMAIRDRGLVAEPPRYSGVVLTGDGIRPAHASGVFAGGSMRVLANSTGRGGRVDYPPSLSTGQFTLAVFLYLETRASGGTVVSNIRGDEGSFALALDESGFLRATVRNGDGELQSVTCDTLLPLRMWQHIVMSVDGEQLLIYKDGKLVASKPSGAMTASDSLPILIGTDYDGLKLWDGRIDELAIFDKPLSEDDIVSLYHSALEEIAGLK